MDIEQFLKDFQDHLATRLDTYEQAVYLYLFRHTRLIGLDEAVIGFKSARRRMACGIGEKGKPMSENTAYEKLRSLEEKGRNLSTGLRHLGSEFTVPPPPVLTPLNQGYCDPSPGCDRRS